MSQLIQILHSPFWGAAIVTIILLNAGDYKWWLIGLFGLFAIFGKIYIKNNDANLGEQPFFRAKLGVGYQFSKEMSISISYDHRSNGRIKGVNPGMETLQANFGYKY